MFNFATCRVPPGVEYCYLEKYLGGRLVYKRRVPTFCESQIVTEPVWNDLVNKLAADVEKFTLTENVPSSFGVQLLNAENFQFGSVPFEKGYLGAGEASDSLSLSKRKPLRFVPDGRHVPATRQSLGSDQRSAPRYTVVFFDGGYNRNDSHVEQFRYEMKFLPSTFTDVTFGRVLDDRICTSISSSALIIIFDEGKMLQAFWFSGGLRPSDSDQFLILSRELEILLRRGDDSPYRKKSDASPSAPLQPTETTVPTRAVRKVVDLTSDDFISARNKPSFLLYPVTHRELISGYTIVCLYLQDGGLAESELTTKPTIEFMCLFERLAALDCGSQVGYARVDMSTHADLLLKTSGTSTSIDHFPFVMLFNDGVHTCTFRGQLTLLDLAQWFKKSTKLSTMLDAVSRLTAPKTEIELFAERWKCECFDTSTATKTNVCTCLAKLLGQTVLKAWLDVVGGGQTYNFVCPLDESEMVRCAESNAVKSTFSRPLTVYYPPLQKPIWRGEVKLNWSFAVAFQSMKVTLYPEERIHSASLFFILHGEEHHIKTISAIDGNINFFPTPLILNLLGTLRLGTTTSIDSVFEEVEVTVKVQISLPNEVRLGTQRTAEITVHRLPERKNVALAKAIQDCKYGEKFAALVEKFKGRT
jgi:hypothetical protein